MNANSSEPLRRTITLKDYCRISKRLNTDETENQFIEFALTGRYVEDDGPRQAVLDTSLNGLDDDFKILTNRDYDSMIGIVDNLPTEIGALMIYPIPDPKGTLRANNHLTYPIFVDDVFKEVPLSHIPNLQLGMWNVRHSVHIFFPQLWKSSRSSQLTLEQKRDFYERGLRPTVARRLPLDIHDWPPSLNAEMFRARRNEGGYAYTSKMVPDYFLGTFKRDLRSALRAGCIEWGEDMFFMLTIRGTKGAYRHHRDEGSAKKRLDDFLMDARLDPMSDTFSSGRWFIDVGVEIFDPLSCCLQWKTDGQRLIVAECLDIPQDTADRITSIGSSKYSRDLSSHLTGVSGCRIEPGVLAEGTFEAKYVQLYTTEKSVTYHPDGVHHAKAMRMSDALGRKQPPPFITHLFGTYEDALENNSSCARIEMRVPFHHALSALMVLDPDVLRASLVAFTRQEWWSYRMYRVLGISKVFHLQATGTPEYRAKPESLLLTAACLWLLNGLHARPEDGPAARRLMDAVLPLAEKDEADPDCFAYPVPVNNRPASEASDEEDDSLSGPDINGGGNEAEEEEEGSSEESEDSEEDEHPSRPRHQQNQRQTAQAREIDSSQVPYLPNGAIFLRRIKLDVSVPRMRIPGPSIPPKAFRYWFGRPLELIADQFTPSAIIPRAQIPHSGIARNRARQTQDLPRAVLSSSQTLFELSRKGFSLQPADVDDGSDVEDDEIEDDPTSGNIDMVATNVYRLFLADVLRKAPNGVGNSSNSYLDLSEHQRSRIGEGAYAETNISLLWRACQYRREDKLKWRQSFNNLFPEKDKRLGAFLQNYRQCLYFKRWLRLTSRNDNATVEAIREAFFKRIWKEFGWLPHAGADRLWQTKHLPARFKRFPPLRGSKSGAAPQILLKQGVSYIFTMEGIEE